MFEKQIEFDKVKNIWAGLAVTGAAKERIYGSGIILEEITLRKEQRDTTNAAEMLKKLGNPPLQDVSELIEIVKKSKIGECLSPYQLERVQGLLVALNRLGAYLKRGKQFQNPIAYYDESLTEQDALKDEIASCIRCEAVDDRASKTLCDLRMQIAREEEQMKQKAEQIMRANSSYMADSYYTVRNGRVCIPVKKEFRSRIDGAVIDKSATGNTVFIEPAAVGLIGEELQLLRIEEENEVCRILYTLTSLVADCADALTENMHLIEKLDYIFSKGKLSLELDCVEPHINTERRMVLKEARHPLMDRNVNVPLNFEPSPETRGVVITGPNTGGKTVAIKTVMLNAVMAQCGLHVCCKEADICMNSGYFCDIGDGQNLAENLSTFSAHITNVLRILREIDRESFVIMDEMGSGTDPAEGMGIAIAILEELRKSGANFLVTTHYPEVKEYAEKARGLINARMTFDRETLRPTYICVIGEAGESCAFYIAKRLGMSDTMLNIAKRAAYGENAETTDSGENAGTAGGIGFGGAGSKIRRQKPVQRNTEANEKFQIGDCVMVYPDRKIGIVCETPNDKGVMRVQIAGRKVWLNHKRVKLHVKAAEMYPEDYDMSIVFDSAENRKKRHNMGRKLTDEVIVTEKDK